MDTTWTPRHLPVAAFLSLVALLTQLPSSAAVVRADEPVTQIGPIALRTAPPVAEEMIRWAVERYAMAGLELPPTDLSFHPDMSGCGGLIGYTEVGRVELCARLAMEAGPQRIVLHELAHAWIMANVDAAGQQRFNELRGLERWSDPSDAWKARGMEQAAEIVAWGLGDGTMSPMIDGSTEPADLALAFRELTGLAPLTAA